MIHVNNGCNAKAICAMSLLHPKEQHCEKSDLLGKLDHCFFFFFPQMCSHCVEMLIKLKFNQHALHDFSNLLNDNFSYLKMRNIVRV